jgi:hypothetical protein
MGVASGAAAPLRAGGVPCAITPDADNTNPAKTPAVVIFDIAWIPLIVFANDFGNWVCKLYAALSCTVKDLDRFDPVPCRRLKRPGLLCSNPGREFADRC